MGRLSDTDFITMYREEGPAALAKAEGIAVRNVHARRARLEAEYGDIKAPAAAAKRPAAQIELPPLEDNPLTDDQVWERHKKRNRAQREHQDARSLIDCKVKVEGPIAICALGDPHVDDNGCDLDALDVHMDVINATEAMFAVNVGDTTNNWIGRLGRLYAEQSTSRSDAIQLARYFIHRLDGKWLFMVGGNHDAWSGEDDPIKWMASQVKALYQPSEVRMRLKFPKTKNTVVVNCRHDFVGNSQWNPGHGPMKAIQMGIKDDIAMCGHKHKSFHGEIKDPENGKLCHAVQVASFKTHDRYAMEKGFRDQNISPSATLVIDPHADNYANRVQLFWDVEAGADYLGFLRSRYES